MNESFTMSDSAAGIDIKPAMRWAIFVLAVVAFVLSLWLTIQKLTGKIDTLAGCGAGSGCANVLGSKWSMVLGVIPVSVFSCILYLALMVSLWMRGGMVRWFRMLLAWMFLAAAVWFTALQLFVMHSICPYCMTMHGIGVVLGVFVLVSEVSLGGASRRFVAPLIVAIILVVALALIQHVGPGPETHRVDDAKGERLVDRVEPKVTVHSAGDGRLVSFMDGAKSYRLDQLPHLGTSNAEHVLVKYFDYTCEGCREVDGQLETIMAKYPGKLAVIVLPVPLERECNPHLPLGMKDHSNACRFAALALRIWRADRSKFAEFHQWLFEYHDQPYEAAEAMAYSLVGADKIESVDTSWVEAMLKQNVADYKMLLKDTPVMPKILLGGSQIMQGKAKDTGTLERLLQQNPGLGR